MRVYPALYGFLLHYAGFFGAFTVVGEIMRLAWHYEGLYGITEYGESMEA